jgi:3-hydroxyisobutyrate dehydrogenase-like beta-hydroxyacid dehydrogenase
MKVGFIGLGRMGLPMARLLLKAGHEVTVYNRTASRAEALQADGARLAAAPAEAAGGAVLMTMLADDAAVEEVIFGPGNAISALGSKSIHVSMSTISVALSRRLSEAHAQAGQGYVAAPVFGRPDAAAAKKLFIVAAGASESVERCRPLFEAIAQRTFVLGQDPVAATVVKLAGNFLIASMIEGLGEAFALTRKSGVNPEQFLEILTNTLFTAPLYKNYGAMVARNAYEPAGFLLPLGLKDTRLVLAAGEACAVPMPLASLVRDHLLSAIARGYEHLDWAAMARVSAEDAGL